MEGTILFEKECIKIAKIDSKIVVAKDLEKIEAIKEVYKELYNRILEDQELISVVVNTSKREAILRFKKGVKLVKLNSDEELKRLINILLKNYVIVYIDCEAVKKIIEFDKNIAINRVELIKRYELNENTELVVAKLETYYELLPCIYVCKLKEYYSSFDAVDEIENSVPENLYEILKEKGIISDDSVDYIVPSQFLYLKNLIEELEKKKDFIKIEKNVRKVINCVFDVDQIVKETEYNIEVYKVFIPIMKSREHVYLECKESIMIEYHRDDEYILIMKKDRVNSDVEVNIQITKDGYLYEYYKYNKRVYGSSWEEYEEEDYLYTKYTYSIKDERIKEIYNRLLSYLKDFFS